MVEAILPVHEKVILAAVTKFCKEVILVVQVLYISTTSKCFTTRTMHTQTAICKVGYLCWFWVGVDEKRIGSHYRLIRMLKMTGSMHCAYIMQR